jgi:Arc/MetJ-type ribon-helix-helix transcriptional regulator
MNLRLNHDLESFIREKVRSGQFPSENAVVEAALETLRAQDAPTLEAFIDHECVTFCSREADEHMTLEEVLQSTSKIPGSMAEAIIEEERADRI